MYLAMTSFLCRNLLRTAIRKGGELDTAPRKAEVLNRICEQLRFDSDVAALLHRWVQALH